MRWLRYVLVAFVLQQCLTEAHGKKSNTGKSGRKKNQVEREAMADMPAHDEHLEETDLDNPHHRRAAAAGGGGGGGGDRGRGRGRGTDSTGEGSRGSRGKGKGGRGRDRGGSDSSGKGSSGRKKHRGHSGGGDDTEGPHIRHTHNHHMEEDQDDEIQCPGCSSDINFQIRMERRIEEIKEHVLTATGLGTPPDMTGVVMSQNPNIHELINSIENSNHHTTDPPLPQDSEDELGIRREKVFTPVEPGNIFISTSAPEGLNIPPGTDVLYFKLDHDQLGSKISRAVLHIWLKPILPDPDTVIPVSVYKIVKPNNTSGYIEREEVTTLYKEFRPNVGNWVRIPVYKPVQEWLHTPESNLGLVVEAFNSHNISVAVTTPKEDPENAPLLEVHQVHSRRIRSRRNSGNFFCTNNDTDRCCRYKLSVNFVKMGWDFIVAPKVYDANFCKGECPYLYAQKYAHSILIQKMNSTSAKHGPCCGARKLTPMAMLYYDHYKIIKYDIIQDMVVEKCGCS